MYDRRIMDVLTVLHNVCVYDIQFKIKAHRFCYGNLKEAILCRKKKWNFEAKNVDRC